MKKFFITIIALIYISTSIGVALNIQYCMGEVIDWGVGHNPSKACDKCGMETRDNEDCCNERTAFFNNNIVQDITPGFQELQPPAVPLVAFFNGISPCIQTNIAEKPNYHSPPLNHGISLYIFYNVYRI